MTQARTTYLGTVLEMKILANLSRVAAAASKSVLPILESQPPNSPLLTLIVSADIHQRRQEWNAAIDFASRVLSSRPKDFNALSILVSSYGHLGQTELAYPLAKRLLRATPPNWTTVKLLCRVLNLIKPRERESARRVLQMCDAEAEADRKILAWSQKLVSKFEATNGVGAV